MYKHLIRPLLSCLPPERAHRLSLATLKLLGKSSLLSSAIRISHRRSRPSLEREVFGLKFPNPVGLAAGFDPDGDCCDELLDMGFGFMEIGTLTPRAQQGNPKPRMFRLRRDKAIVSRMGLPNRGVKHAISTLKDRPPKGLVGASIAMNAASSMADEVLKDYLTAFSLIYDFVDFIVLNVSYPNVPGLQSLRDIAYLSDIVDPILEQRRCYETDKPVLIKISPDTEADELEAILGYCMLSGIDGIVAGNSTARLDGVQADAATLRRIGPGELSGAPLFERNLSIVRRIHELTGGRLPIIGVGGIMTPEQAAEMLDAGASLIEIYTALTYEGPSIVKDILKHLDSKDNDNGINLHNRR